MGSIIMTVLVVSGHMNLFYMQYKYDWVGFISQPGRLLHKSFEICHMMQVGNNVKSCCALRLSKVALSRMESQLVS